MWKQYPRNNFLVSNGKREPLEEYKEEEKRLKFVGLKSKGGTGRLRFLLIF
jgi:hypothetical protein